MSRRRGKGGTPLSLFSFQDVITSITGIMILVVLLLVLEIITHKIEEVTRKPPINLDALIAAAEEDKAELTHKVERNRADIKRLDGIDPGKVAADINREKENRAKLGKEIKRHKGEHAKASGTIDDLEGAIATATITKAGQQRVLDGLQGELEKAKRQRRRVRFTCRCGRQHILVQCAKKGIDVQRVEGDRQVRSFAARGDSYQSALSAFLKWAFKHNKDEVHFIVVVKPSAAPYAELLVKMLYAKQFKVGCEPLIEEKNAIFADSGAR